MGKGGGNLSQRDNNALEAAMGGSVPSTGTAPYGIATPPMASGAAPKKGGAGASPGATGTSQPTADNPAAVAMPSTTPPAESFTHGATRHARRWIPIPTDTPVPGPQPTVENPVRSGTNSPFPWSMPWTG